MAGLPSASPGAIIPRSVETLVVIALEMICNPLTLTDGDAWSGRLMEQS